jgi:hypothetical protein
MNPLSSDEFCDALRKGHGRVALHLEKHGVGEFADEILHACTHNLVYDQQCEGGREDWLLTLIDLTGNESFYRNRLLDVVPSISEERDLDQILWLLATFARRGCERSRQAIYARFQDSGFGERQIVTMDGIPGLLHVAESVGVNLIADRERWEDDSLLSHAAETYGQEAVMAALKEHAESSAHVRAYLNSVTETETKCHAYAASPPEIRTFETVLADIDAGKYENSFRYSSFSRVATASEMNALFERLLIENRRPQLLRLLWIFQERGPIRLDRRLFELATDSDEQMQNAAIRVLAQTTDDAVHDLAHRLLNERPETVHLDVLRLFTRNYLPGDHRAIEDVLPMVHEPDEAHSIGMDILEVAKAQLHPELSQSLGWIYEETPCSMCRRHAIEALLARDRATDAILQECVWDCSESTRTLAKETLAKRS